ncbi:SAM-dependent methyltransferase [Bacterioplanes sanyensis]|uniref:Chemotaxis protein methyltransferase n=1 Tax=Bacterioplanes sanyensis TaxID=1249553 RepID=A0A222FKZ3_9GAMM|nr:CheR family methyltransferase [Bacterioplanes sanyensis]ASP39332.1 SAM-dependent methyltransferase [Bacterioplanes sanyensis]
MNTHCEDISDAAFRGISSLLYDTAGIQLSEHKKTMMVTRLRKRLLHLGLDSFDGYLSYLRGGNKDELQVMLDLMSTNETYFFREAEHFNVLAKELRSQPGKHWRIWCAALSSGEEAYTIGMLAQDILGTDRWSLVGTDISSRMVSKARRAIYPEAMLEKVPEYYRKHFCLCGRGEYSGYFTFIPEIRAAVDCRLMNLTKPLAGIGPFDIVFIRNVLIYFDQPTKEAVIGRILPLVAKDGLVITGHSESLFGISPHLQTIQPSVYRYSPQARTAQV